MNLTNLVVATGIMAATLTGCGLQAHVPTPIAATTTVTATETVEAPDAGPAFVKSLRDADPAFYLIPERNIIWVADTACIDGTTAGILDALKDAWPLEQRQTFALMWDQYTCRTEEFN